MIETATGLVLRLRPLTETSLIVHWLTATAGRVATVAKGARRPQSPFRGKLDLFYLADFSFSRSRRSELHALREVALRESHSPLREDLASLRRASYCAALIEQATEVETPLPAVFELMRSLLDSLCGSQRGAGELLAFELKLLRELGLEPDWQNAPLNAGTRQVARAITATDWQTLPRLKPSEAQSSELGHFLGTFLIHHLGRIPKGRDAALSKV